MFYLHFLVRKPMENFEFPTGILGNNIISTWKYVIFLLGNLWISNRNSWDLLVHENICFISKGWFTIRHKVLRCVVLRAWFILWTLYVNATQRYAWMGSQSILASRCARRTVNCHGNEQSDRKRYNWWQISSKRRLWLKLLGGLLVYGKYLPKITKTAELEKMHGKLSPAR